MPFAARHLSRSLLILVALAATACPATDDPGETDIDDVGDTAAPVITLLGEPSLTVEYGEDFVDPGATAVDDVDGEVDVVVTGSVDTTVLGITTLSYDATDSAGNAAQTVTRTVEVVDTEAPVLSLNGEAELTIEEGAAWIDPGATVTDNADDDIEVVVTGEVDASTAGTYLLTYDAVDDSGNAADSLERTVTVVYPGQLLLVSDGQDLVLVGLDADGGLAERGRASLGDALEAYSSESFAWFGLVQVPGTDTVLATGFNDCSSSLEDVTRCWGDARVDRFRFDPSSLTWEGAAWMGQLPLRMLTPEVAGDTLTLTVRNEGLSAVDTGTSSNDLPGAIAVSTDCEGVTLMPGDTCTWTVSPVSSDLLRFTLDLPTVDGPDHGWRLDARSDVPGYRAVTQDLGSVNDDFLPRCASDSFSTPGQNGACALTALDITDDGETVFINEDDSDVILVLSVNEDGSLFFESQSSDNVNLQGIAVNAASNAVYNGSNAFRTDTVSVTRVSSGEGGNATEAVSHDGTEYLMTTIRNARLQIFDISSDPFAPSLIATWAGSDGDVRFQHHSEDLSRVAVVGLQSLTTLSFDGSTLRALDTEDISFDFPDCPSCAAFNRLVQVTPDGTHAVTAAFSRYRDEATRDALPWRGSLNSYALGASDGAITPVDALTFDGLSRGLLLVQPVEE